MFVAASAGNDGPGAGSVGSPANSPWLMSVGASTHDRKLVNALESLGGGDTPAPADIPGKSLTSGVGPAPIVDAASLGYPLCGDGALAADGASPTTNPFTTAQLSGKIVVCERGTYGRVAKGQVVKDRGAVGMVLVNDAASGDSLVGDAHVLPAVHISYAKGQTPQGLARVRQRAHRHDPRDDARREPGPRRLDGVLQLARAERCARRDQAGRDDAGINILAAFSDQAGPAPQYSIISGTSMSSPTPPGRPP